MIQQCLKSKYFISISSETTGACPGLGPPPRNSKAKKK